jgi:hypothetical protein
VGLRVTDSFGETDTDQSSVVITGQANTPPIADAGGPYTGKVGQAITLDGSASYDPDAGDSIVSYEWDIDNDGQYDDATGVTVQHTWNSVYNGTVGLRVTDTYGDTGTDQTSVSITEIEPETGTIIVEKQTEPDSSTDYFDFSGDVAGSIKDNEQLSVSNLQPGTYTSEEIVPQGWTLISIQCDDDNSSGDVNTATVTFQLEAGETVKAVFTNRKEGEEEGFDYGDAPDPTYPTFLANNGARHRIDPDVYLGTQIDSDTDGQPNSGATGDDDDGTDDEDGVVIKTSLITGNSVNVEVTASTEGYLNAWVDFSQNGSWGEADDHVFINTPLNAGLNNLTLNVASDASPGTTIARFRFSRSQDLSYEGGAEDGEVEDYLVEIDEGGQGASVGDFVWNDLNQNGLQESSEPGIDSVQVSLFDQNGNLIAGTMTNASGYYIFTNVTPGSYFLRFALKSGFAFSPPDQGADDAIDSDVQLGSSDTHVFALSAGDNKSYMDAGMYQSDETGEIRGIKWNDLNSNGVRDAGEPGIANWQIILDYNQDGVLDPLPSSQDIITTTNALGEYKFTNYFIGSYIVGEILQSGWAQTSPTTTHGSGIGNVAPYQHMLTLSSGQVITNVDFGNNYEGTEYEYDFGDAPDPTYPTLLTNNGARHALFSDGPWLGDHNDYPDAELNGQHSGNADGDDNDGNDDENGFQVIPILPMVQGSQYEVIVRYTTTDTAYLNMWVDFDGNGSWADASEQTFTDVSVYSPYTMLNGFINVPANAKLGKTFTRFRISSEKGLSYDGPANDGEVEDYEVEIKSEGSDPGVEADTFGVCLKMKIDFVGIGLSDVQVSGPAIQKTYYEGSTSGSAIDDDSNGLDEVVSRLADIRLTGNDPSVGQVILRLHPIIPSLGQVEETVNSTTGTLDIQPFTPTALADSFFDVFFAIELPDMGLCFYPNQPIRLAGKIDKIPPSGMNVYSANIPIPVPAYKLLCGSNPGTVPVPPPQPDASLISIISCDQSSDDAYDFGDAPDPTYPTLLASNGARHIIKQGFHLGSAIDADPNGHPTTLSDGDDLNPSLLPDDEDGVTMSPLLATGQSVPIAVVASDSGVVNAWLDFNIDGDWADAGEHFIAAQPVVTGANSFTLNVPAGASNGLTHARFRFSSVRNLSYDGLAPDGEVEDYAVEIVDGDDGSVTVIKEALPADNTPFLFCTQLSGAFFSLLCTSLLDPLNNKWTILNPSQVISFTEAVIPGWSLQDITITGDLDNGSTVSVATGRVDIDYDTGENIVITFKNIKTGDDDQFDFGDAPDSPESPRYPTLLANNGARHAVKQGYYLGSAIDAELDGIVSTLSDGDDLNPATGPDDEDGVTMSPFIAPGQAIPITIVASDTGVINAWIDFNIDSDWADAGEHFIAAQPVIAGANSFTLNVPAGANYGMTHARFRFSSVRNLNYDGIAPDGEVEDYVIKIKEPGEGSIQIIKDATPKDNTPFTFVWRFNGSNYYINAHTILQDPSNNKWTVSNPADLDTIRIGEVVPGGWILQSISITGDVDNGSVIIGDGVLVDFDPGENIVITFKNVKTGDDDQYDFGDAPDPSYPTLLASNGARHKITPNLYLGSSVDQESEGQPSSMADGDNQNILYPGIPFPPGDEDGVLMPSIITAGQSAIISVTSSAPGVLNAWLDFNIDGDWADAGEHIIPTLPVVTGVNPFTINVPANAQKGQSYARFRLSSERNINYDGLALDGEVEDYAVGIQQGDGGNITIIKDATPKDNTPFWITTTFGVMGGAAPYRDPLSNTSTITNGPVGTYHFGESVPAGWTLTNIVVTGDTDNGSAIDVSNATVQIDLDAGENITVVFKNTKTGDSEQYDFGDAPSPYPTKHADNGAYHLIDPNFKFGKFIDAESDGLPDANAQGDDKDNLDDESEMSYVPGFLYFLNSTLEMPAQSPVKIFFAIDWERDGSWIGNFYNFIIHNAAPFPVVVDLSAMTFAVSLPPGIYNARWRCYQDTSIIASPTGFGGIGEVEDCQFVVTGDEVVEYDYGDAPLPYPTQILGPPSNSYGWRHPIVAGIHLGQTVDSEADGQPNPNAMGDDSDGNDDEDGIVFTAPLLSGQSVSLGVTASVDGYLNGYIDLNQDQDWADANEQIFFEKPLATGLNNLTFTLPANAKSGGTFARFRFSTHKLYMSLPQLNVFLAKDGEVEDYEIFIEEGGEGPPIKWTQLPLLNEDPNMPYTPYFMGWDEQSVFGDTLVADDWFCKSPQPVTEIHWWGSYTDWDSTSVPPVAPYAFHIGIWNDVPAGEVRDWSHPGDMIWEWTVPRELLNERVIGDDFHPEFMTKPDTCFQYDYFIPTPEWFYQEGDSTIYWLSIAALYEEKPDSFVWGWKTREHYFHDDAVRIFEPKQPTIGDIAMETEPVKHMWDMAFVLNTDEHFLEFDFGDAPAERYPTFLEQNGAHHIYDPRIYLGDRIDSDNNGQPAHDATGDDDDGTNDDDGVVFKSILQPGHNVDVEIKASANGFLNAWADFNNNGNWSDPDEHIFIDQALVAGTNALTFHMPLNALAQATFIRFRFSSESHVPFFGLAIDGEVEDYYVEANPVGVKEINEHIPTELKLMQNYPNPFNQDTEIRYVIPEPVFVRLALYNLAGQEIASLVSEKKTPGSYVARWNGKDKQGQIAAAGIYLYRIEAGNFNETKKLLFLK